MKNMIMLGLSLVLVSCGELETVDLSGKNGTNGLNSLVTTTRSATSTAVCLSGTGITFASGLDKNNNNVLELNEINPSTVSVVCDGERGSQGPIGVSGQNGQNGINGSNSSVLTSYNIPVGNPGACVDVGDGLSARLYTTHTEGNYVTKIYKTSNCSGDYAATLWPNDDDSANSGDEVAFFPKILFVIESLRDTSAYTLYKVKFN